MSYNKYVYNYIIFKKLYIPYLFNIDHSYRVKKVGQNKQRTEVF